MDMSCATAIVITKTGKPGLFGDDLSADGAVWRPLSAPPTACLDFYRFLAAGVGKKTLRFADGGR